MPSPAMLADAQGKGQVLAHDVRETSNLLPTGASHHGPVAEQHDKPVSIAEGMVPPPMNVNALAQGGSQWTRAICIALVICLHKTASVVSKKVRDDHSLDVALEAFVAIYQSEERFLCRGQTEPAGDADW